VTDSDPPYKIGDGEAPHHRRANAPDAGALDQQDGHRQQEKHQQRAAEAEGRKPEQRRLPRQYHA